MKTAINIGTYIKIFKCSNESYWYKDLIGSVCTVKVDNPYLGVDKYVLMSFYRVKNDDVHIQEKWINYIRKMDAAYLTLDKNDCIIYNFRPEKIKRIL